MQEMLMHTSPADDTQKKQGGAPSVRVIEIPVEGYERVIEAIDDATGLHAFIAVHDTTMGPALGGTRMYPYKSREEALTDVLRLSKGMTYKSALAEVGFGGGKSVIMGHPKTQKNTDLLYSFAHAVNLLQGSYICAEDMGTNTDDMSIIAQKTLYVAGLNARCGSGDPSPFTAYGVFRGIQAMTKIIWNTTSLEGKCVAIQGVGHVGEALAEHLFWSGAKLIIADTDEEKAQKIANRYRAGVVSVDEIYHVPCDIFAPCAIGGTLNPKTIPHLQCRAVAGGANNQLLSSQDAHALKDRNILYAPDFVINAGGVINVACEMQQGGYDPYYSRRLAHKIFDSVEIVVRQSIECNTSSETTACELAKRKLHHKEGKRTGGIYFSRNP